MNAAAGPHPSLGQLAAFDQGQLRPAERAAVERHLVACDACCQVLEGVPDDRLVSLLRAAAGRSTLPSVAHAANTGGWTPGPSSSLRTPSPSGPDAPAELTVPPALADHPRYRVLGPLGAGGMGAVFKAEHRLMGRTVALKVINPALVDRPEMVERFRREVRAAARLSHPNIVAAYDAERAGDTHFLVMEFIVGTSLDRVVRERGPLPVAEACEVARQAALGLQHA